MDLPGIPGLGTGELIILFAIFLIGVVPALGVFKIAKRAGYDGGVAGLFAVAFMIPLVSWIALLALGFGSWPRDRAEYAVVQPPA